MVRFKVIKGSHLLLIFSVLFLIGVIVFIALQSNNSSARDIHLQNNHPVSSQLASAEAKATSAFASAISLSSSLKITIVPDKATEDNSSAKADILIYHTHTHEAYEQDSSDPYEAIETWRTTDTHHSIVRVGEALAQALRDLGYHVVHDTSDHELDSLSDAYLRSLSTLESYTEEFDLCIDLHRDAYSEGLAMKLESNGISYAQLMMLVGRGDSYPDDEKPNYAENLLFSQRLTKALNDRMPGICRNVTVKSGRYNQHIGKFSLLIEVGHNKNMLHEALASIPILAESLDYILSYHYYSYH